MILLLTSDSTQEGHINADAELTSLVSAWVTSRSEFIREVWSQSSTQQKTDLVYCQSEMANKIASILTHRTFNYQSKHKLNQGVALVRQTLLRQISKKVPVTIFFLYNGGYRASSLPDQPSLIFEPDQTEWMLLYQIALLNKRISSIYTYGIEFYIVIHCCPEKFYHKLSCLQESSSETLSDSSGLL